LTINVHTTAAFGEAVMAVGTCQRFLRQVRLVCRRGRLGPLRWMIQGAVGFAGGSGLLSDEALGGLMKVRIERAFDERRGLVG